MKRCLAIVGIATTMLFFSGCGSHHDDVVIIDPGPGPGPGPEMTTLFLVDGAGFGVQFVPYTCYDPSGIVVTDDVTYANGEFTFVPGDRCEFDLYGFDGSTTMPLFITDDLGFGKDDIPYDCDNGIVFTGGLTDGHGYFDYPVDAFCRFYL